MSGWLWVFVIVAGLLVLGQRYKLKRRHRRLKGQATLDSEACHKECVDLLREAIASGDENAMRQAMDKTTKSTLWFIPIGRPYLETELENECSTLWHQVARKIHGELPTESQQHEVAS